GDVHLRAFESIVSVNTGDGLGGKPIADVIGNSITLEAGVNNPLSGTIGKFDDDLQIDSAKSGPGVVTSSSVQSTHVVEVAGDLSLNTVSVINFGETAFIAAPVGNIFNGRPSGANVLSGKAWLFAALDIGQAVKPIITEVGKIEGKSVA